MAANNDTLFDILPPYSAPLESLVKSAGFPALDKLGGHCGLRKMPCASNGRVCMSCGKRCPAKSASYATHYERRLALMRGVLK